MKYTVTVKPTYSPAVLEIEADSREAAKEEAISQADELEFNWEVESIEERSSNGT
jgi:hypothetical protein